MSEIRVRMPAGTMAPDSPKNLVTSSACISSSTSHAAAILPAPKAQPPIWRTSASTVIAPWISACIILSWFIFLSYVRRVISIFCKVWTRWARCVRSTFK
ncbi:MAG: hypothetical protein A4E28_01694 [Methanocella sp. PtaU1.Bin125]|nr:MAG: hypothetical protein A4E28_01694 [Methanocella sp. PtaU1.Bin125]